MLAGLEPRVKLSLYYKGVEVADRELAEILYLVKETGSMLSASRILGIPYSRVWERIARAEKQLEVQLVEAWRGGRERGGARLTKAGLELLRRYESAYHRLLGAAPFTELAGVRGRLEGWIAASSHDLLLSHIIAWLREKGLVIEAYWVGSTAGLYSVLMGEAHLAGLHLYDKRSREYNKPFYESLGLKPIAVLVKGYLRSIGFASRRPLSRDEAIEKLLSGELRLVNRQKGSGTRALLDNLIEEEALRRGIPLQEAIAGIKGYEREVKTHLEVAEEVANGSADIGVVIEQAARAYGLEYTPIWLEHYDFIVARSFLEKEAGRQFIEALKKQAPVIAGRLHGYTISEDIGEIIAG
ncbi:MAG: LysR family transcriptional regulator [Desulfurococcus sp.]|nr:LysR family transcriptional regulator [Desulfurococcus sp.]